jgi:hypothetical protein
MLSGVGVINDTLVNLVEKVFPSGFDIDGGTVGGSFKDQKADVEILPRVGICIE